MTEGVFTYVAADLRIKAAAGVKCSRLPTSDRHSLLAYVGDIRPRLFGDGERGGTREPARSSITVAIAGNSLRVLLLHSLEG